MPRDYFGQFMKDFDRIFRDANEVFKRNFETLASNVQDETRRMTKRVDALNRWVELEKTLKEGDLRSNTLNEKDKKFLELMETIHRIVDRLQNAHTLCSPMYGEDPHVNPGALEDDIAQLEQDRQLIRDQINSYRLLVASDASTHGPQLAFLNQVDSVIQGRILRTICLELRNVIDRGQSDQIREYGNLAGSLIQQFDGMVSALNWELSNVEDGNQLLPGEHNNDINNSVI